MDEETAKSAEYYRAISASFSARPEFDAALHRGDLEAAQEIAQISELTEELKEAACERFRIAVAIGEKGAVEAFHHALSRLNADDRAAFIEAIEYFADASKNPGRARAIRNLVQDIGESLSPGAA